MSDRGIGLLLPPRLSFCLGMLMSHQLVHSLNGRAQMLYSAAPRLRVTLSLYVCTCVCLPLSEPQFPFPSWKGLGLHARGFYLGRDLPAHLPTQPLEQM